MRLTQFEIDGIPLVPQPTDHRWESGADVVIGKDGNGAAIRKKYRSCILRVGQTIDGHNWSDFLDGSDHVVRLPAPGTPSRWVDYRRVRVDYVGYGPVAGASGVEGLEMRLSGIPSAEVDYLVTESDEYIKV